MMSSPYITFVTPLMVYRTHTLMCTAQSLKMSQIYTGICKKVFLGLTLVSLKDRYPCFYLSVPSIQHKSHSNHHGHLFLFTQFQLFGIFAPLPLLLLVDLLHLLLLQQLPNNELELRGAICRQLSSSDRLQCLRLPCLHPHRHRHHHEYKQQHQQQQQQ